MAKILLVEDDALLADSVKHGLALHGHIVDTVANGDLGLTYMTDLEYDVVILDWELPGMTGVEVCRRYRATGGQTPVLILTARATIDDKEEGFNSGADDYQTKPFEIRELRARIKSLLRRPVVYKGQTIVIGDLTIDTDNRLVKRGSEEVQLQAVEYALLEFFVRHPNTILSPDVLLQRVWTSDSDSTLNAIYSCVKRIRQKLTPGNKEGLIRTVYGMGYRFVPPEST